METVDWEWKGSLMTRLVRRLGRMLLLVVGEVVGVERERIV